MSNGYDWNSRDPRLRTLRTLALIVVLCLLVYTIVFDPEPDAVSIGTLAGVLLVVLGFEVGVNWPKGGPPNVQ